jgi:hypothetical protein
MWASVAVMEAPGADTLLARRPPPWDDLGESSLCPYSGQRSILCGSLRVYWTGLTCRIAHSETKSIVRLALNAACLCRRRMFSQDQWTRKLWIGWQYLVRRPMAAQMILEASLRAGTLSISRLSQVTSVVPGCMSDELDNNTQSTVAKPRQLLVDRTCPASGPIHRQSASDNCCVIVGDVQLEKRNLDLLLQCPTVPFPAATTWTTTTPHCDGSLRHPLR